MSIDTQAYLFVHFIGEERNPTDEQLYFALSRDGVHWRDLRPAGSPALTHLLPWRLGAERWRHHEWIDRPGDLGLP